MAWVSRWIVGMFAAWLLGVAPSMAAPPGRVVAAALRVDAFDVEQVPSLAPGSQLQFSVFASPGASATVMVEGVRRLVELREVQPGVYEGTYVIDAGDRLHGGSTAVATVWRDGAVARATLEESLVLDGAPPTSPASPAPFASPGPAIMPRAAPPEIDAPSRAPLHSPVPYPAGNAVPPVVRAAGLEGGRPAPCRDCAVVEWIREVEAPSGPAHAGAIAGGIAGALFGEKIGKAHERHVTRVLGALSGAVIGHEIQRSTTRSRYDAALRLPDGALRVRRYDAPPPFRVGQLVRLEAALPGSTAPAL